MHPLDALGKLHPMFQPQWEQPKGYMNPVQVPEFTTDQLNPGWAKFLDAYGASEPEGASFNPRGQFGLKQLSNYPAMVTRG